MALTELQKRANWLVKAIAARYRGINPLTSFSGQAFMQLGDPNNPTQDALVEILEPVTLSRAAAVPGTWPEGTVKKTQAQVKMYHVDEGILMSHEEIDQAISRGEIPSLVQLIADAVHEKLMGNIIPDVVSGFFQYSGVTNARPTLAADVVAAKAALDARAQGMYTPAGMERVLLCNQTFHNALLGVSEYIIASSVGDSSTMATGKLTPKMGFGTVAETSYLEGINSTTGTATGVKLSAEMAAGKDLISIVTAAGAGTVKIGSVFTIAGSAQRHVIRGGVTTVGMGAGYAGRATFADITLVNGTAQNCAIYPPLPATLPADSAFTFVATHGIAGLAFHPLALVCVTRKFPDYQPGSGIVAADQYDPITKVLFRVHTGSDYMRDRFAVSASVGATLASPRWGSRVIETAN